MPQTLNDSSPLQVCGRLSFIKTRGSTSPCAIPIQHSLTTTSRLKTTDHEELSLSWNPMSSTYDTRGIRRMLGATIEHLSLRDCVVFALKQPSNWQPVAENRPQNDKTIGYISETWLYGFGGFNGVGSENGDGSQRAAVFTSEGKASYLNSVHRSHTAIALDILNRTKNPMLALQEIMTITMQMSFYDFLQQFDVSSPADCTISSDVEIPLQWNGFATIIIHLLLHFSLVLISISLFLRRTELSLLGNAWQAVAHGLRRCKYRNLACV